MTEVGTSSVNINSNRSRRGHQFGGCSSCRRRHLKCDRKQPTCQTCQDSGLVCGYGTDLTWVSASNEHDVSAEEASAPAKGSARRFLYSEALRLSMSKDVQAHLLNHSVNESLAEIDALGNETVREGTDVVVGPFGIFSSRQDGIETSIPMNVSENSTTDQDHYYHNDVSAVDSPDVIRSVQSFESFNFLEGALDWPDLFDLDFQHTTYGANDALMFDAPDISWESYIDPHGAIPTAEQPYMLLPHNDRAVSSRHQLPRADVDSEALSLPGGIGVSDAQMLLQHFKTSVIDCMSSLPVGDKNHWDILHCRAAIQTLANITFMRINNASHAAMSNLMALLAISARHMSHSQPSIEYPDKWKLISDTTLALAKEHLRSSLQTETSADSVAKYKDQNMSLSAMLAYAVRRLVAALKTRIATNICQTLYDCQREARAYMIDAERLLRTRGFTKRTLSRKARMLHHIYTWTRILNESTYVLRNYKDTTLSARVKKSIRSTGKRRDARADRQADTGDKTANMDDFLRLGSYTSSSGSHKRGRKGHAVGLRDVHLEDVGDWPETLYMQLYGVQEEWLSLVSQTTRLANVSDTMDANNDSAQADLYQALQRRKQTLENLICAFAAKTKSEYREGRRNRSANDSQGGSLEARACMVQALASATVIFFYRRIRDVNPWILQGHVDDVIDALQDFQAVCLAANNLGPGSPWPCFIAGCEAITQSQRHFFAKWLEQAFSRTGFERFNAILRCIKEVWARRDEGDTNEKAKRGEDTWFHVCRDQNAHILVA